MEIGKSTKPFSESSGDRDLPEFNLPDDPHFAPLPPQLSIEQMIERIRQLRLWFPGGIPTPEERWRAKTHVEFKF